MFVFPLLLLLVFLVALRAATRALLAIVSATFRAIAWLCR
jgi:hypothetical protein